MTTPTATPAAANADRVTADCDSDEFAYTRLLLRIDPEFPALPTGNGPDAGTGLATHFPVITAIWRDLAPDTSTVNHMSAVLAGFCRWSSTQPDAPQQWQAVEASAVQQFIAAGADERARRLRKNTLHAAFLALRDAGLFHAAAPTADIDPVPEDLRTDQRGRYDRAGGAAATKTRRPYQQQVHVRAATHDEILLVRLASRLAGSSRAKHLCPAAVAICCATATTGEAPQVLWRDHTPTATSGRLALPGRATRPGMEEQAIAARTVELDTWGAAALADWHAEKSAHQPVNPAGSVLYGGSQPLTSTTAGVCVDHAVRKALDIADLRREPGLSAGSLRLWAAARHVTDAASLHAGAAAAGIAATTLHREFHQLGERRIRLS